MACGRERECGCCCVGGVGSAALTAGRREAAYEWPGCQLAGFQGSRGQQGGTATEGGHSAEAEGDGRRGSSVLSAVDYARQTFVWLKT